VNQLRPVLPPNLDYSKVFLTYVSLLGNVEQTAIACELDPLQVSTLARRDNWDVKVKALLLVKEKQGAEAFARELNRTANFVQALRCRNLLDQTLQFFTNQGTTAEGRVSFAQLLTHRGAKGETNLSAKNVADLTKAIQTVHQMTYAALGDTAAERPRATKPVDEGDADPSMAMVRALSQLNTEAHFAAGSLVAGEIPGNAEDEPDED
jgi:hypothetical protein